MIIAKNFKPRVFALSVVLSLSTAGCLVRVNDRYFRSNQPETALERAQAATAAHCGGVFKVDTATGVVVSRIKDTGIGDGIMRSWRYRCVVTVSPDASDGSVSVRVAVQPAVCGFWALAESLNNSKKRDEDAIFSQCETKSTVPADLKAEFDLASERIQQDVFRAR